MYAKAKKLTSWSYSRYAQWFKCPFAAKCKFIDKLPEPPAPAMERGNVIHKLAEQYTIGDVKKLPPELVRFKDQFAELKASKPQVEQTWAFRADWSQTTWNDWNECQLRVKTDAACLDETTLYVIDHKTGKLRDGYGEQLGLYRDTGILKYPHVKEVNTQMWFLDSGDVVESIYDVKTHKIIDRTYNIQSDDVREKTSVGISHKESLKLWDKKVKPMLADTAFKAKPGNHCRFCAFSKSKGGPCQY